MASKRTPKPQSEPPTADYVTALWRYKTADGDESRLRVLATNFRTLTRLDHAISIPAQYRATTKEIRTPFVRDAWERITASLTHNDWLLHLEPKGDSDEAKRASGIGERWGKLAAAAMDRAIGEDVPYEAARAMVRDIESVIKLVHIPQAWATFPQREKGEQPDSYLKRTDEYKRGAPLPFAWRTVDRLSMLFEDGEFGDAWAIEFGEYPRPLLAREYGMRGDPMTGKLVAGLAGPQDRADRPVEPGEVLGGAPKPEGYLHSSTGVCIKLEYFDADWWTVIIDGATAPGFPKPNPYAPRLPYARAKPSAEPESVLYSLLFLVPALDAILTGWSNWMWLGMFPNPILEDIPNSQSLPAGLLPPRGDDAENSTFTWSSGKMLEVPRGKRFSFMQPPPVGADAKEMVLILRAMIDIAGIPSVFRGLSTGSNSGYEANQMISAVEMMYKRLGRARERQLEQAVDLLYFMVPHNIKQTVYVLGQGEEGRAWLGLSPKGNVTQLTAPVEKLGEVQVTVRPDMAVMQQARAMIAKQAIEGPPGQRLMSQRKAMEFTGDEDPDRTMDEIWVEEQIATNPQINTAVVEEALRKAGFVTPQPNAAAGLVGPDGMTPLIPGPPGGIPGQVSGGLPSVPGLNMPLVPPSPQGGAALPGGRPAGMYPGQPPQGPNIGG